MRSESGSLITPGKDPFRRWLAPSFGLLSLGFAGAALAPCWGHEPDAFTPSSLVPVRTLPGVISNSFGGYHSYLAYAAQFSTVPCWFRALPFLIFGSILAFLALGAELFSIVSAAAVGRRSKALAAASPAVVGFNLQIKRYFRHWTWTCVVLAAFATAANSLLLLRHLAPLWRPLPPAVQIAFFVQVLISTIVVGVAAQRIVK